MFIPRIRPWHRAALLAVMVAAALGLLAWQCLRNPAIMFLPTDGRANWILFPAEANVWPNTVANLQVVFRREFVPGSNSTTGMLNIRAARQYQLRLNGQPIDISQGPNWKKISSKEIGSLLRAGTNVLEVAVVNDIGPPLLWLELECGGDRLRTDTNWIASAAGSSWRAAATTSPILPGPGNSTFGGEDSLSSLKVAAPIWIVFAVMAAAVYAARRWWLEPLGKISKLSPALLEAWPVLGICAVMVVLFLNNLPYIAGETGFDVVGHRNYIVYLQKHHSLPWPNEGWEMFQPPLYYLLTAVTLGMMGISVQSAAGDIVVRAVSLVIALGQCVLIYLAMRRVFSNRRGAQVVGFAVASLVPMHLYLVGSVGNETLEALLISLALWLFLRMLDCESVSWKSALGFGVIIGLAMLAKVTVALVLPVMLLAWSLHLLRRKAPLQVWFRSVGISFAAAFAVCGWYYLRTWIRYGTPVVGNWDAATGFAWWQAPGYHTLADYFRFGQSLSHPFFSALCGFPDAIYSTLFGDGEYLGHGELNLRPPWNYHLMAAGYRLALVPAALALTGLAASMARLMQKPGPREFALVGMSGAVIFGVVFMSLKIASFAQMKAFYGLCLLIPFGYFAATGWELATRRQAWIRWVLGVLLGLWCVNNVASLFVLRNSTTAHLAQGSQAVYKEMPAVAVPHFEKAVGLEPANPWAKSRLATALLMANRASEALEPASRAVALDPSNYWSHLVLGAVCEKLGQVDRAVDETRRAISLGPESIDAYHQLTPLLAQAGRMEEAGAVARDGLAVEPHDVFLHDLLGRLLVARGDEEGALEQFQIAVTLESDYAPAQLHLGQVLLQRGDFINAGSHFIAYRQVRPNDPEGFHLVALAHQGLGNGPAALTNLVAAAKLAPENPAILRDLAWLLATSPDATVRNGAGAVQLAERACALVNRQDARSLGVLAAAYAEAGRFTDAVKTAQESISLGQKKGDKSAEALGKEMLGDFESNHPYRQPLLAPTQAARGL